MSGPDFDHMPRYQGSALHDPLADRTIVFGDRDRSRNTGCPVTDLWVFDLTGNGCRQELPPYAPRPRYLLDFSGQCRYVCRSYAKRLVEWSAWLESAARPQPSDHTPTRRLSPQATRQALARVPRLPCLVGPLARVALASGPHPTPRCNQWTPSTLLAAFARDYLGARHAPGLHFGAPLQRRPGHDILPIHGRRPIWSD
jgi:hypothetical protein